ncbi:hypothetical protein FB451DRAFT_1363861 [Mycena latifolia]|nr:hypothetical protein FB451DRAFT_1363861 [Mycena latifolia]
MYTLPAALLISGLAYFGSVHGYVAREDSPGGSPVDSASLAAVTPSFSFNKIVNMITCTPATITWTYVAPASDIILDLELNITNNGVPQPSAPASTTTGTFATNAARIVSSSSPSRRDLVTQDITDGTLNPAERSYTWPSVNVASGWYILTATLSFQSALDSEPFYVEDGTNTSCLGTVSTSTSASSSVPSTTFDSTSSASPTSSGGVFPVDAVSSKVNRGAIAGGVIGGLAVLAAAIAAYFYLRYASASGASPARRGTRKWGGLGSTDSKAKPYPSASRALGGASDRHHSQSDSVGPMLDNDVYVIGNVGIDSRGSRMNEGLEEEDEVNSYFSPSQEKFSSPTNGSPLRSPFSDPGHDADAVPMDLITPLPGSPVTRNSSTSTSSYMNNNFSRPRSHPSSPYSGSPTSPTPDALFSNSANNNTTSSLGQPESSSPSPAFPSGTSQMTADSPPPRRGSAGEPLRRTPRKPVPQYNPTDPSLTSPPLPPATPLPAVHDSDSSREGSVRSGRSGVGLQDLSKLSHKASFGDGRPVHYLIPDMPPPQRE